MAFGRRDRVDNNRTFMGYTKTMDGMIPHLIVTMGGITLAAPVVLETTGNDGLRRPKRASNGHLYYALPGGFLFSSGPEVVG